MKELSVAKVENSDIDITKLSKKLKRKSAFFMSVDDSVKSNLDIICLEREFGVRIVLERGYDVISNCFFVVEQVVDNIENVCEKINSQFNGFLEYFQYLQGDIYKNACYYQYFFSEAEIDKFAIDISKINYEGFVDDNIDEYTLEPSKLEIEEYSAKEKFKKAILKWIKKFNTCLESNDFNKMVINFKKSGRGDLILGLVVSNYVITNINNNSAFANVMSIANANSFDFVKNLCLAYEPTMVYEAYNSTYYSAPKIYKRKLKLFIENLKRKELKVYRRSFFDEKTHFFVYERTCRANENCRVEAKFSIYFNKFEDLAEHLKNDISYCDLSKAILKDVDFSKYKIGQHVILPIENQKSISYELIKKYDRFREKFIVEQNWANESGYSVKSYFHVFDYFFDFVRFLKNDLSKADLLFCDGLLNVKDFSRLNLSGAVLKSEVCDLIGEKYNLVKGRAVEGETLIEQNELDTALVLSEQRDLLNFDMIIGNQVVYYVSDIHLLHRFQNAHCKTKTDEHFVIQSIVDKLLRVHSIIGQRILLIGGDIASDYGVFKQFISVLRKSIAGRLGDLPVVFVLGNHELWSFPGEQFSNIVRKYKKLLSANKMYLVQNSLLLIRDNAVEEISEKELNDIDALSLRKRVNDSRLIIFGGMGFSGCNTNFNADNQIYRGVISREQEVVESKKIEDLYKKICQILPDKRVVVFTHMPQKDWCHIAIPHEDYIYVSGHSHRNYFFDNGVNRIYSDNQIGYRQVGFSLKYFLVRNDYDIFDGYRDGVYVITTEKYKDFYRGKNIRMTLNFTFAKIHLLKRDGFYMFIEESDRGLSILNGGRKKRLSGKSVLYYYEHMSAVIQRIKSPLVGYRRLQKDIADKIKIIGGSGCIHGAIIDIDFFNHVFVNPFNSRVIPYYAEDMVRKIIYPNIDALLQENCRELYGNYLKKIEERMSSIDVVATRLSRRKKLCLDTDIYKVSLEIRKMEKLYSNILTVWIEPRISAGTKETLSSEYLT